MTDGKIAVIMTFIVTEYTMLST